MEILKLSTSTSKLYLCTVNVLSYITPLFTSSSAAFDLNMQVLKLFPDLREKPIHSKHVKHHVTFDKQVSGGGGRPSHKLVFSSVSKVNISDGERVRELPAADLTSVRRLDLYAVLQPFVGDALIVDGDLEGDGVSLLSV